MQELKSFFSDWDECDAKTVFLTFWRELEAMDGSASFSPHSRSG